MSGNSSPACAAEAAEEELGLTLLWGTWELWCDLPPAGDGPSTTAPSTTAAATAASGSGAFFPSVARAGEQQNWLSQVRSFGLFDSAEGFWGLFNCIKLPSQLPPNGSYYLFRKHIAPMWEHEANRRGGKWVVPFSHACTAAGGDGAAPGAEPRLPVDVAWMRLCLSAIAEGVPGEEMEICGVTISRGRQRGPGGAGEWKLCLWTRTADSEEAQMAVAAHIKELLELTSGGEPPSPGSAAVDRREDAAPCMTFLSHRALMEAKQDYAKGAAPSQQFRPLYAL